MIYDKNNKLYKKTTTFPVILAVSCSSSDETSCSSEDDRQLAVDKQTHKKNRNIYLKKDGIHLYASLSILTNPTPVSTPPSIPLISTVSSPRMRSTHLA